MTSFHNACTIVEMEHGFVCREHSVPVYRDGIDWQVDPTFDPFTHSTHRGGTA